MERISATSDLAVKKVLASEENKDVLQGLIVDFFNIKAEEISIENPYSIETYQQMVGGKKMTEFFQTIKDVAASFKVANFVSEIQVRQTHFFDERALYYPFNRFCKNYGIEGEMQLGSDGKPSKYSSLKPIYALNILGYSHFADDEALRIFELYDPKRNKAYKKELIYVGFFELSKTKIETPNQQHWRDYFTTGKVSDTAPEYIKKASWIIEWANLKEEEREMVELLEKAQADHDNDMVSAYLDGKEEEKLETAKIMLGDGVPRETVAKYTRLSLAQIKAL